MTDYGFGAPTDFQAKLHSADDNDVYFYIFNHRSNTTLVQPWRGSMHATELEFMFGHPLLQFNDAVYNHTGFGKNVDFADSDVAYSEFMITLWINFIKFGNPTPDPVPAPVPDVADVTWSLFSADEHRVLWMGTDAVEERNNYRQDYYAFSEYYFRHLAYGEEMP